MFLILYLYRNAKLMSPRFLFYCVQLSSKFARVLVMLLYWMYPQTRVYSHAGVYVFTSPTVFLMRYTLNKYRVTSTHVREY